MLIALNKKHKEKQTNRIIEKSTVVILSIINEINNLEKDLGEPLVGNFRNNTTSAFESYSDEKIALFRQYGKKLMDLSQSVFLPFSIRQIITHPDIDPAESIAHIYSECEEWLKNNNPEVLEGGN